MPDWRKQVRKVFKEFKKQGGNPEDLVLVDSHEAFVWEEEEDPPEDRFPLYVLKKPCDEALLLSCLAC